jgi:hypothetical protein
MASVVRALRGATLAACCLLFLGACPDDPASVKWEYRVFYVGSEGHSRTGAEGGEFSSINPIQGDLDVIGQDGWELAGTWLEPETAWANFGNDKYVTGLQPNVRSQRLGMVFKRRAREPE